jgi:hypothetical protein
MPTPELLALSSRLSIGAAQVFRNLAVLPLIDGTAPPTGWLTLDQAIGRGVAEISEISEHGSVPQLRLCNRASEPLFLLDGEELVGAKQNRVLNLSILAPAGAGLEIPVSCVEQGRWSWRSRQFQGTERVIYSKLRRSNSEAVSFSLNRDGSSRGDQGRVWDDIDMKSARMSVHSDTSAASALYEHYGRDLDEFVGSVEVLPGQVGAAFLVNGRFAGLDLLGGPDLVPDLLPKLVRSYALDALEDGDVADGRDGAPRDPAPAGAEAAVRAALEGAGRLSPSRTRAVGEGEDVRLRGAGLVGAALISGGGVAHLSLWSADYR